MILASAQQSEQHLNGKIDLSFGALHQLELVRRIGLYHRLKRRTSFRAQQVADGSDRGQRHYLMGGYDIDLKTVASCSQQ